MKKLILALSILLAVSFSVFFLFIRQGDERQIRRNLISLTAMVSKSVNEDGIRALANIRRVKSFFTPDCQIAVGAPIPKIQGHDMLISTIHQARRIVDRIDIDLYDISVILGDSLKARTIMTAVATGLEGGERIIEAREIEMHWKKVGNQWKIAKVQLIPTLR